MNDPFLSLFLAAFPFLVGLAILGFAFRILMLILAARMAVRQVARLGKTFDDVARGLPAAAQVPPYPTAAVAMPPPMWTQSSDLQNARLENRKAEMMSVASRAGINWKP